MAHPLEDAIRNAGTFVVIGDSRKDRFPAMSYANYTKTGVPFYCVDLGGLTESRGGVKGGVVYNTIDEVPDDRGDLAVIWVHPKDCESVVEQVADAGFSRVWFSFKSASEAGVAKARERGLEVIEIGRCPVYYLDKQIAACKAHTLMVKVSGAYGKPPQTEYNAKRRELM